MRRRVVALAAILGAGLSLLAVGCASPAPHDASYTYHPDDSPVDVDTASLRDLKASAGIAGCPAGTIARAAAGDGVDGLPSFTLPCLGGGDDVDLAGLRGPMLLNFWSQTCGPCREESPILQDLSDRADGKVAVVGVDFYDPRPSYALAFAKQLGLTYPQLADPMAATKAALHVSGLPMTFFVDGDGKVVYTQSGPITSASQLESLIEQHLGVSVHLGDAR